MADDPHAYCKIVAAFAKDSAFGHDRYFVNNWWVAHCVSGVKTRGWCGSKAVINQSM